MKRARRAGIGWTLSLLGGVVLAEGDGKPLYDAKCAICHGINGVAKPMGKGSANFNDPAYGASSEEIVRIILEGKGKMPKMEGKLSVEEAQSVADYVRSLRPAK